MLLGFKRRFAPLVQEGSKRHTIRAKRKNPFRPGMMCDCYVDPRQKSMRLLGRWICTKVEDIEIYERGDGRIGVVIDGHELVPDEKDMLAWQDGFREGGKVFGAFFYMVQYWVKEHRDTRRVVKIGGQWVVNDYVNYKQGEPRVVKGGHPLAFSGDIIHWEYTQEGAAPGQKAEAAYA